jgi:hypothetical protein
MGAGGCYSVSWSQDGRHLAIGGGIPGITLMHPPLPQIIGPIPPTGAAASSASASNGTSSGKGPSVRRKPTTPSTSTTRAKGT